jgi:hypothetical protein
MTLDEDDVDAIARRVLTLIRDELSAAPVRLVTAKTLAEVLDVKPSWVYAHAAELQAVRLGGDNGRLRFDLDEVQRRLNGDHHAPNRRRPAARQQTVMEVRGELLPLDPSDE